MIVRGAFGPVMVIAAGRTVPAPRLRDTKRAGHAEMHQQDFAGRKIDKEIFGASAQSLDRLALQAGDEVPRQRPAQVVAMRLDLGKARALHHRLQPAADRFDFRQFGHRNELPHET